MDRDNAQFCQMTIQQIKEKVSLESMQKFPLNMELLEVCTSAVIDYEKAEELLKHGAEPLGYVEDAEGWPDNLYNMIVWKLYDGQNTKNDYYNITDLFLRYGMDIAKPAVPYDDDWVLNPIGNYIGVKNDCMLRTMQLLLDHGLTAKDAAEAWSRQISDFVNCCGSFSDEGVQIEFPDYVHMLMLIASYPHVLDNDLALQREIWFSYNQGRCDLQRFREWDWYDYVVDCSHCDRHPEVWHSHVKIVERQTSKTVWEFGVSLSPEAIMGKEHWA